MTGFSSSMAVTHCAFHAAPKQLVHIEALKEASIICIVLLLSLSLSRSFPLPQQGPNSNCGRWTRLCSLPLDLQNFPANSCIADEPS